MDILIFAIAVFGMGFFSGVLMTVHAFEKHEAKEFGGRLAARSAAVEPDRKGAARSAAPKENG